jgi:glyoxylase-like metal-dependent hydrolase (beta-lactamase superfamily II)
MKTKMISVLACALVLGAPALAQQDFSSVQIQTSQVAEDLYLLVGQGGNIALSTGDDGAFIVDTQFAPLSEKIQAAVTAAGGGTVEFVVNTHWHGDHSGGNVNFGGAGATIMAHDNVQVRMSTDQVSGLSGEAIPASPPAAIPVVTYPSRMTFHWNGDTVDLIHIPNAHTDGDTVVHFTNLNAFHMGDTYVNGGYPFVDVGSAGTLDGIIAAGEKVLSLSDAGTKIIPGHGALATPEDLRAWIETLATIRDRLKALIDQERTEDEVVAANPTSEWNATLGAGFMNGETFTRLAYQGMTR